MHRSANRSQIVLTISLTLCLLVSPYAANAKDKKSQHSQQTTADNTPTKKKKGVSKVTYQRSPSEETRTERDRRMYRECKGLHNAGACRGYTHP